MGRLLGRHLGPLPPRRILGLGWLGGFCQGTSFRKTSGTNLLILTAPEELGPGVPMGTIQTLFDYNLHPLFNAIQALLDVIQTLFGTIRR